MDRLKAWWSRFQDTPLWQAWKRYGDNRGSLLAGGVGYFAFFSLIPALLLAFTVFGIVLRNQPDLLDQVKEAINEQLPGFIKTADNPDGVIAVNAPSGRALSVAGLVSLAGLAWAGTGWLGAIRDAIRQIFGVEGAPGNFILAKLRDLAVLLMLGVAILLSAAVGAVAGAGARWLAGLIGLGDQGWILTVIAFVIGVALDASIIMLMLRVLTGVDVPWRGLRNAAIFGGLGLTLLKKLASVLLGLASGNPAAATFGAVVGLLLWLNYMSRVILVSAAWAANDLDTSNESGLTPAQRAKLMEGPAPEPLDSVRARTDAGLPTFGKRAADRTTLAAGVVLGAVAATGLGAARRGIRTLLRRS
jgi:membrane protein